MSQYPFFWPFMSALFFATLSMAFAVYMAWLANSRTTRAKADDVKREADEKRRTEQMEVEQARLTASHAVLDRLEKLDSQLAILQIQIAPFWAAAQTKIAKDLTHPSPQFHEMDELLRKLEALHITEEERVRLHELLDERAVTDDPEVSESEKTSAALMRGVMDKVLEEASLPPGGDRMLSMVIPGEAPEEGSAAEEDKVPTDDAGPRMITRVPVESKLLNRRREDYLAASNSAMRDSGEVRFPQHFLGSGTCLEGG